MINDHPARKLALKFMAELRQKDDEIERLQGEITQLHAALGNQYKAHKTEIDRLCAEIERLKIAVRDQAGVELSEENDRLIAKIERLQGELHSVHAHLAHMRRETERLRRGIEELKGIENVECPSCRARRDNCRLCGGSGVVTEQQARDWPDAG